MVSESGPPPGAVRALARCDPRLATVIGRIGAAAVADPRRGYPRDHFAALVRAILGQQVSVPAAAAMYARLLAHHGGRPPTPGEVLAEDPETLRAAAGLSRAKLATLRTLAAELSCGRLDLDALAGQSDDEVLSALVALPGIGPWTAQVFMMLHLEREDVVCAGDLGIRRAVQRAYGLDVLPDAAAVTALAQAWRPHRTLACRFLWAFVAAGPV